MLTRSSIRFAAIALAGALAFHGAEVQAKEEPSEHPAAQGGSAPRTLHGYIEQEKFYWDFLKANHPLFTVYEKQGRVVGKPQLSDREEEFVEFGGGKAYHEKTGRIAAITYRLPEWSFLDLPNQFVGPEKCGECHPVQYEKWMRSRHALTLRFPDEVKEVPDLVSPLYGSQAAVLPEGITPDSVYAIIGGPRTKYGFLDPWLVRGTYHIEGGTLRDRTGTLVAGGNQHSGSWARFITPAKAKEIAEWVPGFPTKLEDFGDQGSNRWGMTSYGAKNRKSMLFQPASSYCETCHSMKFDFKSKADFLAALGKPEELRKHTISKGIACEECHGAGAHLVGARAENPSNCERCHQRFAWIADEAAGKPFNAYFKSRCPSCGTEGSQAHYTAHRAKGMTCSTCHDPHEVTSNDWRERWTVPALKKTCQDCHAAQAKVFAKNDIHGSNKCTSCHMPVMMSCENFQSIQFPDHAGFDTQRTSHIWKIRVDPEAKSLNPPPGKPRDSKEGPWRLAQKDGKPFLDLQWSCGRTSWGDGNLAGAGGCHSPVQSELPKSLHFRSQRQIYDVVVGWQKPVVDGVKDVRASLASLKPAIAAAKPGSARLAEAQLYVNQAEEIVDALDADGSSGVHAPKFCAKKVAEAKLLVAGAAKIVAPVKAPAKTAAK
jgi:hypothetical protein